MNKVLKSIKDICKGDFHYIMTLQYNSTKDGLQENGVIFYSTVRVLKKVNSGLTFNCKGLGKILVVYPREGRDYVITEFSDYLQKRGIKFYEGKDIIVVLEDLIHMKLEMSNLTLIYENKATTTVESDDQQYLKTIYNDIIDCHSKYDI